MLRSLLHAASPLAISIGFDADPPVGGDVTPAPAPPPSLLDDDAPADPPPVDDPPADDPPADDPPADDPPEPTDEEKEAAAKAEEERRAALSDEERAEEDRRAALTQEERDAEDAAKAGAPDEYKFELEGDDAPQLDEKMLEEFTGLLREDNLTQAQADRYMGFAQQLQQSWLAQITEAHTAAREQWRTDAKADKTIGGEKFAENVAVAKEARKAFGDDELAKLLNETGVGDHPAMIRFMYNVGVVNREHGFVKPGRVAADTPFYDHPSSQPKG